MDWRVAKEHQLKLYLLHFHIVAVVVVVDVRSGNPNKLCRRHNFCPHSFLYRGRTKNQGKKFMKNPIHRAFGTILEPSRGSCLWTLPIWPLSVTREWHYLMMLFFINFSYSIVCLPTGLASSFQIICMRALLPYQNKKEKGKQRPGNGGKSTSNGMEPKLQG